VSGGGAVIRSAGNADTARLIRRFTVSERIAHWLLATAFAAMLASGVFMGGIGPLRHHAMLAPTWGRPSRSCAGSQPSAHDAAAAVRSRGPCATCGR
jgi:hypothetical protein